MDEDFVFDWEEHPSPVTKPAPPEMVDPHARITLPAPPPSGLLMAATPPEQRFKLDLDEVEIESLSDLDDRWTNLSAATAVQ
jgi:hypothetical protein